MVVTRPARTQPAPGAGAPDVVAAGALVVRKGRVLLVHRPKYDDWSFPKGKQDPGELTPTTAVREVLEETGVEIRLGRPASGQTYLQTDGRTKLVHYWRGHVVGDPRVCDYEPNREIDRVEWVPAERVADRLSYRRDRVVLDDVLAHPRPTGVLAVLRHAKARSRKAWRAADSTRPLLRLGEAQATRLVPLLTAYGVTRVVTSDSTRCLQSVGPYAEEHVLGLGATPVLAEGHEPVAEVGALVGDLLASREPTVLCTHRPVLPSVLDALGLTEDAAGGPMDPADLLVVHHRKGSVRAVERHRTR